MDECTLQAGLQSTLRDGRWETRFDLTPTSCVTSFVTCHTRFQVDYEHGHTAATYTQEYDAIVSSIWKLADPSKRLLFRSYFHFNIYKKR
jgi:hypothetical protein